MSVVACMNSCSFEDESDKTKDRKMRRRSDGSRSKDARKGQRWVEFSMLSQTDTVYKCVLHAKCVTLA